MDFIDRILFKNCLVLLLFPFLTTGCKESYSTDYVEEDSVQIVRDAEILSEEIWISDAQKWLNLDVKEKTFYVLYGALSDSDEEIEMHFDSRRQLFLIQILNAEPYRHRLFCENGMIVFSDHLNTGTRVEKLLAYANGKIYAAAELKDDRWQGILPEVKDLQPEMGKIKSALRSGLEYQEKELSLPIS